MSGVGRVIEYAQSILCEIFKKLIEIILKICQDPRGELEKNIR